jgi:hypothetical protein
MEVGLIVLGAFLAVIGGIVGDYFHERRAGIRAARLLLIELAENDARLWRCVADAGARIRFTAARQIWDGQRRELAGRLRFEDLREVQALHEALADLEGAARQGLFRGVSSGMAFEELRRKVGPIQDRIKPRCRSLWQQLFPRTRPKPG